GELRAYGRCDVEFGDGLAEPAARARGEIARAMLYMAWAYPKRVVLSDEERAWCIHWSERDPPEPWERARARKIHAIQGNPNPFVR
ncbi:MAG: endonuclease, partial [Myxococcota bacterium]